MAVLTRPSFEYGNARLRARRDHRLSAARLAELAGRDTDGLLSALAATDYREEVEAALARGGGLRPLHEAVRAHEARELEQLRGFYDGRARELVDVLLARFDLHNLLALLRGVVRRATEDRVLRDLVPVGAFAGPPAREVARQHEAPAAIALLVSWRLPDPVTARAVARAYEIYERDGDLAGFEDAVSAAHTEVNVAELASFGREASALRATMARRIDDANVLALLRVRAALERRELPLPPERVAWLPGGEIPLDVLEDAVRRPAVPELVAVVVAARSRLREPLEGWVRDGDAVTAQRTLDRRRLLDELGLYGRGDPLGIAIPIAYVAELELEARNVRLLVEGAALGLGAKELRERLIIPGAAR